MIKLIHAREMTKRREMELKAIKPQYTYITINECQFDQMYKNIDTQTLLSEIEKEIETTFIHPRCFYFGGRVNAIVLLEECEDGYELKYYDFTSLYPAVMKSEKYPLGNLIIVYNKFHINLIYKLTNLLCLIILDHPEIVKFPISEPAVTDISNLFGLVTCQVLPPPQLHIPVLPVRFNDKLLFALCQKCLAEDNKEFCEHTDPERSFTGTWGVPELELALEYGYKILRFVLII
jgi:hypothetical protein